MEEQTVEIWPLHKIRGLLLANANMTFEDIAEVCNTTKQNVSHVASGKRGKRFSRITYRIRRRIADEIGAPFEDIWGVKDELWYGKFV